MLWYSLIELKREPQSYVPKRQTYRVMEEKCKDMFHKQSFNDKLHSKNYFS